MSTSCEILVQQIANQTRTTSEQIKFASIEACWDAHSRHSCTSLITQRCVVSMLTIFVAHFSLTSSIKVDIVLCICLRCSLD